MAKSIDDKVAYYYDFHPTEEDLKGETTFHSALVRYLMAVLQWLFQGQHCAIYENLNFYQTSNPNEKPIAPDIAVIKGVEYLNNLHSWRVGRTGPAPHVVFEIASDKTWKNDLREKPDRYAQMGVQEYFAYDPQQPPVYRGVAGRRLFGWQLGKGIVQEMPPGPDGRLWSAQLNSFLLSDGSLLSLFDRQGKQRLTEAEAERVARQAALREAEAEREAREAEARRAEALAEKLRSLGIDPDQL